MTSGWLGQLRALAARVHRYLRLTSGIVSLAGSLMLHSIGNEIHAYAQTRDNQDYALQSEVAVNAKMMDQMEVVVAAQKSQLDEHMKFIDMRLADISDKIALIQGVGTGVLGVLGVLQILGFVKNIGAVNGGKT